MPLPELERLYFQITLSGSEEDDFIVFPSNKRRRPTKSVRSGTEYIGVTRNQSKFQALIMLGGRKRYIGTFSSEEKCARAFDKFALVYRGLKVLFFCVLGWSANLLGENELRLHERRSDEAIQIGLHTANLLILTKNSLNYECDSLEGH